MIRSVFRFLLIVALLASAPLYAQSKSSSPSFATLSAQANASRDADRLNEAVMLYQRALALRPNWVEGWWSLGTIEYDTNAYAPAAHSFQKLLVLQPKNGMAHAMLGRASSNSVSMRVPCNIWKLPRTLG